MTTQADSVWSTVGSLSTAVGVVVAIVTVIVSGRLTRRGQDLEREQANAAAGRTEAAARLTEAYTQRVVDALETIARSGLGGVPAPPPKVRWSMDHQAGNTYRLTNIGDAKALNVHFASDETLQLLNVQGGPDLDAGEAMTFIASVTLGTRDRTITVNWNGDKPGNPRRTWRYPLPGPP